MKLKVLALIAAFGLLAAGIAVAGNGVGTSWVAQDTAGQIIYPSNTTNGPLITFKPSANVHMAYDCSNGTTYTVGSYHSSGTKVYGTSSGDAKIYMYDTGAAIGDPAVSGLVTIPAASTVTETGSDGWTAGWSAIK